MNTSEMNAENTLLPLALLALGKTGADVERMVRKVRRTARRSGRAVSWADLENALLAGQADMSADLRRRAAVHEAGHAVVYTVTGVAAVQSASIGLHGIGMVTTTPNASLPQNETWLMNSVACLLAGRAAELTVIGEALAGGGGADESDLARATAMALAAETSLGFSGHQPLLYRSATMGTNELALDRQLAERVNRRLENAEAIARRIIDENRRAVEDVAAQLDDVGVMSGDEVRQLVGRPMDVIQPSNAPP
ncbi:ATP-dependent Zn protease [Pararhizobium gei]|uniref:ATP-dependent Zn protease n=1 Tax=Pararhizobium gei TaxID=1395951 RepID=UPI0023DBD262|nr:ATP-dependent Zn protease [Rhizobium gei]